jgi:outer membrane protein TolC
VSFRFLSIPLLAVSLFVGQLLAGQDTPTAPELPAAQPLEVPARVGILGEVKLTLQDVIQRVLDNDRELLVSRLAAQESVFNVNGAKGYYDPVLAMNAYRLKSVTPVASLIGGAADGKLTQKELFADPQVSGNIPWLGGSYKLDFSSSRQSTDSTFTVLNPQFPTAATLGLTQPLWRGLRFDANRYRIQVARKNGQLTTQQLRQRVMEVVTQAIESYWELDFAYRNLLVQIEAVRLAESQDMSNRRQVRQGILAPVDVIQTQTQVATFQQNVFTAQESLTQAENALKMLMLSNKEDALWGTALVPTSDVNLHMPFPELGQAIKDGLSNRPEISEGTVNIDLNRLDSRLNAEQARPQIDAVASLRVQGLSGRAIPVVPNPILEQLGIGTGVLPSIFPGGYSQSLDNLYNGTFPTVQVGVQMSLPIRNRTALAQVAVAAVEGRRLAAQQQAIEMTVESDVRNALQSVAAAKARLDSAASARKFAEEQYASEQRQFRAGTSSVFLVLQRQTDLIAAKSRELRAQADVGRTAADLDRATGKVIEAQNIEVAVPAKR